MLVLHLGQNDSQLPGGAISRKAGGRHQPNTEATTRSQAGGRGGAWFDQVPANKPAKGKK